MLDEHLVHYTNPHRKNGSTRKTRKSATESFDLNMPHESLPFLGYRAGSFNPQVVKKHQARLTDELKCKVLALYALGNSYQDIRTHITDLYGMSLSHLFILSFSPMRFTIKSKTMAAISARLFIPPMR